MNINKLDLSGRTQLHKAFLSKKRNDITELIQAGIDVNIKDDMGDSVIMYASQYGWKEEVKQLLEAGANINEKDLDTNTPIIFSVGKNKKSLFEYLVFNNDLNQLNEFKEQIKRANLDHKTVGLCDISDEQRLSSTQLIDKVILELILTNGLMPKTSSVKSNKL